MVNELIYHRMRNYIKEQSKVSASAHSVFLAVQNEEYMDYAIRPHLKWYSANNLSARLSQFRDRMLAPFRIARMIWR